MSQSLSQTSLAITRNSTDFEWLQGALAPLGQVVSSAGESLDELLALVDVTRTSLVFVGLDREYVVARSALIEGALEAKPMQAIVALGDGMDNQFVLNAMRAGAQDFIAYGSCSSEVAGLARRLSKRLPPVAPNRAHKWGVHFENVRQDVRRDDDASFPSLIDRTGRARSYRHRPCIGFLEGTL